MKVLLLVFSLTSVLLANGLLFGGPQGSVGQEIAAKIIEKAYNDAGIQVRFEFKPVQQSLIESNSGKNDGQISRSESITKKFSNLIKVPVSTISIEAVVFSKDDTLVIEKWSDLKDKDFMIVHGVKFIEYATKDYKKRYAKSFDEAMKALHDGEVSIVVTPKIAGLYTIFEHGFKEIHVVSVSLQSIELFHFLHKKHKDLVAKIQPYLEKMKKHSEMQSIKDNYLISKLHSRLKKQ